MNRSLWFGAAAILMVGICAHRHSLHGDLLDVSDAEMSVRLGGDPCNAVITYETANGCYKTQGNTCTNQSLPCGSRTCPASCVRNSYFAYMLGTSRNVQSSQACPDDIQVSLCTLNGVDNLCICDAATQSSFGCNAVNYTPLCGP